MKTRNGIAAGHTGHQRETYQSAAADPGVTNDSADTAGLGVSFRAGDLWVNLTDDTTWTCQDATVGAAVWVQLVAVAKDIDAFLQVPVAPYFVSGGVPVAKAAGVTVNGITDDLDQVTFHADWTKTADAGNRTIAATVLGAEFKDTVGDTVYFGLWRDIEPSQKVQIMAGVKFISAVATSNLWLYVESGGLGMNAGTYLLYDGAWKLGSRNNSGSAAVGAVDGEYQLSVTYDPVSGYSVHHDSNVAYDADDGWPMDDGSWAPVLRRQQTITNEITTPKVSLYCHSTGGCEVLVRNLRVRYLT